MVSKIISRDDYLNKLIAFKDKQLIKVITGIRRCGKSTIMEIYGTERRQVHPNFRYGLC